MKKLFAIALAAAMTLSLAACGTSSSAAPSAAEPAAPSVQSLDDLTGKKIGVQLGTTGDIYASDLDATIERYNKGFEAVQALQQNKIDAVIIDDQPAKVFVSQNTDLMILEEPFETENYAMCVSKDNAGLTAAMNAAMAELKADGTLQGILDYYIGQVDGAKPYESPADADHSKGKLTMATNAEFPPYEFHEGGSIVGVDVDFARAICDKMGYELVIEDMAFDSIIVAVQSGKADFGAAGMTVTEDRLKSIDFTDSYCTATQVVIVKK